MQGFFAVMKTECFAVQGELMMDELMKQIEDYMDSYNQRIIWIPIIRNVAVRN